MVGGKSKEDLVLLDLEYRTAIPRFLLTDTFHCLVLFLLRRVKLRFPPRRLKVTAFLIR